MMMCKDKDKQHHCFLCVFCDKLDDNLQSSCDLSAQYCSHYVCEPLKCAADPTGERSMWHTVETSQQRRHTVCVDVDKLLNHKETKLRLLN